MCSRQLACINLNANLSRPLITGSDLLRPHQVVLTDQIDTGLRCLEHIPKAKNLELGLIRGYCRPNKEPMLTYEKHVAREARGKDRLTAVFFAFFVLSKGFTKDSVDKLSCLKNHFLTARDRLRSQKTTLETLK